jgi:hypothetical protein
VAEDVDTFTVWLNEHEVDPVVPSKIRCTAETDLEGLLRAYEAL